MLRTGSTAVLGALLCVTPLVAAASPTAVASAPPPVRNGDLVFVSNVQVVSTQAPRAATYDRLTDGEVPEYSPDGRFIAFARDGVYVRDVDTGAERRVSDLDGDGLTWSPDGREIAVSHGSELDALDVATGSPRHVHTEAAGGRVSEPAWSPDGSRIAFSTGKEIKLVRPDGTGLRSFTKVGTQNTDPDWSPDSRTIAFITDRYVTDPAQWRSHAELVTLPRSGQGAPVRVSHRAYPQGLFLMGVAWSPDGRKIAVLQFNRNALPDAEDTDERFKVRAYLPDGSHSYSLTGPIVGDDGPEGLDWAPRR
jgi:Tol biopolymer transport system component